MHTYMYRFMHIICNNLCIDTLTHVHACIEEKQLVENTVSFGELMCRCQINVYSTVCRLCRDMNTPAVNCNKILHFCIINTMLSYVLLLSVLDFKCNTFI